MDRADLVELILLFLTDFAILTFSVHRHSWQFTRWNPRLWHPGKVLGCIVIAGFRTTRDTKAVAMDILDIFLLALVLWIAVDLLNDGGWGGGKRNRSLTPCLAQSTPA